MEKSKAMRAAPVSWDYMRGVGQKKERRRPGLKSVDRVA